MERSVQFNLLALETMHHGKRTLGSNREATQNQFKVVQQRGFSSVGRASALQAECQRFESVNLHHSKVDREKLIVDGKKFFNHQQSSGPVAQLVRAPP